MSEFGNTIGFIGGGNMGEAMAGALINAGRFSPDQVRISDISPDRLDYLKGKYGVEVGADNAEFFVRSEIVVLAVKPQQMAEVLKGIVADPRYRIDGRKLVISIAAGIPLGSIADILYPPLSRSQQKNLPLIRVMPNTPALVLAGMAGISPNPHAGEADMALAKALLQTMGEVLSFEEHELDAVTGVSGSGPAYVFYLAEGMIAGGIAAGLSPEASKTLTLATIRGALRLMEAGTDSPEELRRKVTSPHGTTEAALKVLEGHGVKDRIQEAVVAAKDRSVALSQGK